MHEHYQVSNQRLLWWAAQQPASALSIPLAMLLPHRTIHRRVSFDIKARRNESLLEAFKSLFSKQYWLGCHRLASGWVDRDPGQAFLLKSTSRTYITRGMEHNTLPRLHIPFLRLRGCFLYFHRRLPLSSSHGPLPLTCLAWIKKNTIATRTSERTAQEPSTLSPKSLLKYCVPHRTGSGSHLPHGEHTQHALRCLLSPAFFSRLRSPHLSPQCLFQPDCSAFPNATTFCYPVKSLLFGFS